MRWTLRSFPNVRYASDVTATDLSSIIITPQDKQDLALISAYRGQDFVWRIYPGWGEAIPPQVIDWLYFRQATSTQQQIILWARADRFPGDMVTP